MTTYNLGIQTPAATTLAPYWALRAVGRALRVYQIQIAATAATQANVGLAIPNPAQAPSPAPSLSTVPLPVDPRDIASTAFVDTAWGTAPQMVGSPVFERQAVIGPAVGNGVTWTWSDRAPLIVPANSQICLFQFGASTGPILTVNVVFDE